jgi:putative DNA primase/helicase
MNTIYKTRAEAENLAVFDPELDDYEIVECEGGFKFDQRPAIKESIDTNVFPDIDQRPCYRVYDDWIEKRPAGVYWHDFNGVTLIDNWICAPLHIDAITHDKNSNNFGRYLRFKPTRGKMREWCMVAEHLAGSGEELRRELLNMGLEISTSKKNKDRLLEYINRQHPAQTYEIATQTGWHNEAFILPDQTIGSDKYFYQSEYFNHNNPYKQVGTLEQWQQAIARYCVGNPLLILSVCTAFAGALLDGTNQQTGGGFHVFGESSKGKSTGLFVSCSIFGNSKDYKRSWKATSNGMEATATMFNDSLLALDEISECNPLEIGAIVYALANGAGKARANKYGGARATNQWRVMVLSNGERSVESHMNEAGKDIKAGQVLRLLNIPIFGEFGAFNQLHDKRTGRELSDWLQTKSTEFYGVAGVTWLEQLIKNKPDLKTLLETTFNNMNRWANEAGAELSSQEQRALNKFALVALSGELATGYGVTGWERGTSEQAAFECFIQWRKQNGTGDIEQRQILQSVKDFIDVHGNSRFIGVDVIIDEKTRVTNQAGYWKIDGSTGNKIYLFNKSAMKEALKTSGFERGIEVLKRVEWLVFDSGRNTKTHRVNGALERFYCVKLPIEK